MVGDVRFDMGRDEATKNPAQWGSRGAAEGRLELKEPSRWNGARKRGNGECEDGAGERGQLIRDSSPRQSASQQRPMREPPAIKYCARICHALRCAALRLVASRCVALLFVTPQQSPPRTKKLVVA